MRHHILSYEGDREAVKQDYQVINASSIIYSFIQPSTKIHYCRDAPSEMVSAKFNYYWLSDKTVNIGHHKHIGRGKNGDKMLRWNHYVLYLGM